jgi:hypothetical protein
MLGDVRRVDVDLRGRRRDRRRVRFDEALFSLPCHFCQASKKKGYGVVVLERSVWWSPCGIAGRKKAGDRVVLWHTYSADKVDLYWYICVNFSHQKSKHSQGLLHA